MAIHKFYLSPCNRKESGEIKESGQDNPNGYSEFLCPDNTVMTGRWHKGDENGKTKYEYAELRLVDENGNLFISPNQRIIVGIPKWSTQIKESSGHEFQAPYNQVIVGRRHYGDENGYTQYATATVTVQRDSRNPTVTVVDKTCSDSIKESDGKWFNADSDYIMTGRYHEGDENGETYYISGRLEIDCSEVDKELYAYRVDDVQKGFNELPNKGTKEVFKMGNYFDGRIGHIQGYTQYEHDKKMHYIFTRNETKNDYGYILMTYSVDSNKIIDIRMPKGYNHPAGIQCIGQYLFVPCEKGDKSSVFIYDLLELDAMKGGECTKNLHLKKIDFNHRAGCVGITDYVSNGKHYYLMVLGANEVYHTYRAEIDEEKLKNDFASIDFEEMGSFTLDKVSIPNPKDGKSLKEEKIDCQGIGLVTDSSDGAVYMVAPVLWNDNIDWVYLFKLSIIKDNISATLVSSRKMEVDATQKDKLVSVHYRWGAGIRIRTNNLLVVLATARNINEENYNIETNHWNH